ncbi:MAG TPA: HAD-IB family phosphatase [Thermoanaerobaculia bacterium]|nr:HAD-IB family phosphatase [Thermoanaerobaculia bacterium]
MKPAFELVFFDVDSTLVTIEGIDVLAAGDPEIARLTEAAMEGLVALDEVYGLRLERIRPTREDVDALARRYLESMVPGAEETIAALRNAQVEIHLVTAGIRQAVLPLAARLGIGPRAVHAVELEFGPDGSYAGFDSRSPLARSGGKQTVVLDVRARSHGRAAFVGDGATDLEARDAVDRFIGFGGVRRRERVAREAHAYVDDPSLTAVIPLLESRS